MHKYRVPFSRGRTHVLLPSRHIRKLVNAGPRRIVHRGVSALCGPERFGTQKGESHETSPHRIRAGRSAVAIVTGHAADIDWKKVDAALGKTAAVSGEVHRYGLPRSDLRVTLDGIAIKPALALGGWVAFAPMHDE